MGLERFQENRGTVDLGSKRCDIVNLLDGSQSVPGNE